MVTTALPRFNYGRYLASREWASLKRAIRERSGGICERCHFRPAAEVNHMIYERIGAEKLEDLEHLCKPCHRYESAVIDWNPANCNCDPELAADWVELLRGEPPEVYEAAVAHAREVTDAYR